MRSLRFEEALAKGDATAIAAVAEEALRSTRPCLSRGESPDPACSSSPFEDACADVPVRTQEPITWECSSLVKADSLPTLALCLAERSHPEPVGEHRRPGLATSLQLLRTVFVHGGRLHVRDWPQPDRDLYFPANAGPRGECEAQNEHRRCVHQCDVNHGRWVDPCAEQYAECGDCGASVGGDDESLAVQEARRAAEEAEAEATRARQEVEYQECLVGCEPSRGEEPPDPPPGPKAAERVEVRLHFVDSPGPGLLVVEQDVLGVAGEGDGREVVDVATRTLLLSNEALVGLLAGKAPVTERGDAGLRLLASFQDARAPALAVKLKARQTPPPGPALARLVVFGGLHLVGLAEEDVPTAFSLAATPEAPAGLSEGQASLCQAVTDRPQDFAAVAADLARGCVRQTQATAEHEQLTKSLAEVTSLAALKGFGESLSGAKALLSSQRRSLESAQSKRKEDLARAEVQTLKDRLGDVADLAGLRTWLEARDAASPTLSDAQRREVEAGLEARRAKVAKAELEALVARLPAIDSLEALVAVKAELPQPPLLTPSQRGELERALRRRERELQDAKKAGGAR